MLELFKDALTLGLILSVVTSLIARFVPNEKLFAWGVKFGKLLNGFGTSKVGSIAWEKIEDFLINSVGEFLRGIKSGLDDSEGG